MKVLSINQSVKEFNEDLRAGLEEGFTLKNSEVGTLVELCSNLIYYFKWYAAQESRTETKDSGSN